MRLLILAICLAGASAARADVVTDLGVLEWSEGRGQPFIYYRQDDQVVQARCPLGAALPDRTTCNAARRTVAAAGYIAQLLALGPRDLEPLSARVRETQTQIDRVDQRRTELLATPEPDDAETRALQERLDALEEQQATADERLRALNDQIAQARARLAAAPNDADVASALAALESAQLDQQQRVNDAASQRSAVRGQLVDTLAANQGGAEFVELSEWRVTLVEQWEQAKAALAAASAKATAVRRLAARLANPLDLLAIQIMAGETAFADFRPFASVLDTAFGRELTAEGRSDLRTWYVNVGRGRFYDPDSRTGLTIEQWDAGVLLVRISVSGLTDFRSQCFEGVDATNLDYHRTTQGPMTVDCTSFDGQWGDTYGPRCTALREETSPDGRYGLHTQFWIAAPSPDRIAVEMHVTCYRGRSEVFYDLGIGFVEAARVD
jgi:hypothetical protein